MLLTGILRVWQIHPHYLLKICEATGSWSTVLHRSSLLIFSGEHALRILRRQLLNRDWSLQSVAWVVLHVCYPADIYVVKVLACLLSPCVTSAGVRVWVSIGAGVFRSWYAHNIFWSLCLVAFSWYSIFVFGVFLFVCLGLFVLFWFFFCFLGGGAFWAMYLFIYSFSYLFAPSFILWHQGDVLYMIRSCIACFLHELACWKQLAVQWAACITSRIAPFSVVVVRDSQLWHHYYVLCFPLETPSCDTTTSTMLSFLEYIWLQTVTARTPKGGRNSSVGSAWPRCPQRHGFDPPLGTFFGREDFSLGVNMGSNSIPPKTPSDESINRGLVCAYMHFIARTQKILTFMS